MKKHFLFISLLFAGALFASSEPVDLSVRIDDYTSTLPPANKTPARVPEVDVNAHTLTFYSPCDGCTLRIIDEEGQIVFITTIIPTSLTLPTDLSGDYELQIIRGNWCFFGPITL